MRDDAQCCSSKLISNGDGPSSLDVASEQVRSRCDANPLKPAWVVWGPRSHREITKRFALDTVAADKESPHVVRGNAGAGLLSGILNLKVVFGADNPHVGTCSTQAQSAMHTVAWAGKPRIRFAHFVGRNRWLLLALIWSGEPTASDQGRESNGPRSKCPEQRSPPNGLRMSRGRLARRVLRG